MPALIPLSRVNPAVHLVRCEKTDNHLTSVFMKGYSCQLLFILEGHGFLQTEPGYLSLRPGTVLLLHPGTAYDLIAYSRDELSYIALYFDYVQTSELRSSFPPPVPADRFNPARISSDVFPSDIDLSSGFLHLYNMQHFLPQLQQLSRISRCDHRFRSAVLSARMKSILCDIFAAANYDPEKSVSDPEKLFADIAFYFSGHYMNPVSNADVATALNYHPNYLNRILVRYTGETLHRHLLNYRIARAVELLLYSSASVTDIARSTGFGSLSHFSKTFQDFMGVSPVELRSVYCGSLRYIEEHARVFLSRH